MSHIAKFIRGPFSLFLACVEPTLNRSGTLATTGAFRGRCDVRVMLDPEGHPVLPVS